MRYLFIPFAHPEIDDVIIDVIPKNVKPLDQVHQLVFPHVSRVMFTNIMGHPIITQNLCHVRLIPFYQHINFNLTSSTLGRPLRCLYSLLLTLFVFVVLVLTNGIVCPIDPWLPNDSSDDDDNKTPLIVLTKGLSWTWNTHGRHYYFKRKRIWRLICTCITSREEE